MAEGFGDFVDRVVRWRDETRHGSVLSERLHQTVRLRLYPRTWARLSAEMEKPPASRMRIPADELCSLVREDRADDLHRQIVADPSFWRPEPDLVRVDGFDVSSEECGARIGLSPGAVNCTALRTWLRTGETDNPVLAGLGRRLDEALAGAAFRRTMLPEGDPRPLMIGHACVSWSDGDLRLWTDPFLRPKRLRYPRGQQPLSSLDAPEHAHAVLITHCHPDHFDPASLLLFPRETTVIVPEVAGETPLAFDMAFRARQLGFRDVRALAWGDSCAVGKFRITALPFFGEQPLGPHADQSERRDRNQGATYHVVGPGELTALFLADAGADPAGSSLEQARRLRRAVGRVDLVFGNHRRWLVFPPQLITTSVPQNLCYVPDEELRVPQLMMLTPEQLTEIGEVLSARHVIPYAMGNAPWFAEIGLGLGDHARGPGAFDAAPEEEGQEDAETLVRPAARRTILAAGDCIDAGGWSRPAAFPAIDAAAFTRSAESEAPMRALALGGVHEPQLLRDLLQLTRVDAASYLVAAPGFVEIATTDPDAGIFLWELAGRLVHHPEWTHRAPRPLVAGPFAGDPGWLARFADCHRRASRTLRDTDEGLAAIRPIVEELRAITSSAAVEDVALDLLGIRLVLPRWPHGRGPSGDVPLPAAAGSLIATHGRDAVTAALLLVKLIHNVVLTMAALGRGPECDEREAFGRLLDGDAARVKMLDCR